MGLSTGIEGGNTRKEAARKAVRKVARPAAGKRASALANMATLNGIGSAAVEKATGKGWADWIAILDRDGAGAMTHREIAIHLHEKRGVGDWWSQMVTVGYEQAKGRRQKHEKPGGFEISGSKTLAAPVAKVFAAFRDAGTRARWLPGETIEIRKATPGKSMRITWTDGTSVSVNFYEAGPGKSKVSLQHGKLKDAKEAERRKSFWRDRLEAMKAVL